MIEVWTVLLLYFRTTTKLIFPNVPFLTSLYDVMYVLGSMCSGKSGIATVKRS